MYRSSLCRSGNIDFFTGLYAKSLFAEVDERAFSVVLKA